MNETTLQLFSGPNFSAPTRTIEMGAEHFSAISRGPSGYFVRTEQGVRYVPDAVSSALDDATATFDGDATGVSWISGQSFAVSTADSVHDIGRIHHFDSIPSGPFDLGDAHSTQVDQLAFSEAYGVNRSLFTTVDGPTWHTLNVAVLSTPFLQGRAQIWTEDSVFEDSSVFLAEPAVFALPFPVGDSDLDGSMDWMSVELVATGDLILRTYYGGPIEPQESTLESFAIVLEGDLDTVGTVGEVDSDGFPDILARDGNVLHVFKGTGQ